MAEGNLGYIVQWHIVTAAWHLASFKLTLQSRVFLEKLVVTQLVMKLCAFYGTQRFITMFTRACH